MCCSDRSGQNTRAPLSDIAGYVSHTNRVEIEKETKTKKNIRRRNKMLRFLCSSSSCRMSINSLITDAVRKSFKHTQLRSGRFRPQVKRKVKKQQQQRRRRWKLRQQSWRDDIRKRLDQGEKKKKEKRRREAFTLDCIPIWWLLLFQCVRHLEDSGTRVVAAETTK